jgi:hypothetical protein
MTDHASKLVSSISEVMVVIGGNVNLKPSFASLVFL